MFNRAWVAFKLLLSLGLVTAPFWLGGDYLAAAPFGLLALVMFGIGARAVRRTRRPGGNLLLTDNLE